jgi:hemolysin activation/secretion protein
MRGGSKRNHELETMVRYAVPAVTCLLVLSGLACFSPAWGQQRPLGDVTGRSSEQQLPIPETQPAPPPRLEVPPRQPTAQPPGGRPPVMAFIREIRVVGNTVFTAEQLAPVTAKYVNRELTSEDIEALRLALTIFYVNHGYVNSGAVIPDQAVADGVLNVRMIEGRLSRIDVEGNRLFRPGYIRNRIDPLSGKPLDIYGLQERLQILQQDERIRTINANLKPGLKPGEATLDVKVREESPFRAYLDFNNYQSPTVGAEMGLLTLQHLSLTGHGDVLSLTYGESQGIDPRVETFYSLPFNRYDGTVTFEYRKNDFSVIESPFQDLDMESKADIYGITVRQPVYRTVHGEIALSLMGEYLHNKTYLLDEPFSFYPGVQNGRSAVSAIRGIQEWTYRSTRQFVGLRSTLSLGVDAIDSTINGNGLPDSRFFSWLLQGRWAVRHRPFDMQTLVRIDTQLTPDSLLPLEQISVGGRYTVRGYRESQLIRDNAVIASIESRFPLVRNKGWASILELCAFYDFGHGWNTNLPNIGPTTLDSVGLGFRWELARRPGLRVQPMFEVYWGIPLRNVETEGGNLQDEGIHVRFLAMYW